MEFEGSVQVSMFSRGVTQRVLEALHIVRDKLSRLEAEQETWRKQMQENNLYAKRCERALNSEKKKVLFASLISCVEGYCLGGAQYNN